MGPVTIGFGVGFIALGLVGYFLSDPHQPTALIPAAFGLVFVLLGVLARQDRLRMHVMHLAALVGVVGFVIPLWRVVKGLTAEQPPPALAVWMNGLMAGGCLVFLVLCVKSFIDARRRRRQEAGS
jgi:hypothetical protein